MVSIDTNATPNATAVTIATCGYIFRRGASKGTQCSRCVSASGAKFCSIHVKKVLDVQKFPTEIMRCIVSSVQDKTLKLAFQRLCKLAATCREYRGIVNEQCQVIYDGLNISPDRDDIMTRENMSAKRRLHLLLESGCTRCGTPRITKVHWPFPLRVCQACIRQITVPDYILETKYKLYQYSGARYIECTGWNRFNGETVYRAYLIKDVERDVGATLDHLQATIDERNTTHIAEIASALDTTVADLKRICCQYMSKNYYFPNKRELIMHYWRGLAKNVLQDRGYQRPVFATEYDIANRVVTREDYDGFISMLQNQDAALVDKMRRQEYENQVKNVASVLYAMLKQDYYFSSVPLQLVIPAFFTRNWTNDTIETLQNDLPVLKLAVANFMEANKLVLPFTNKIGINIARQMMQYPMRQARIPAFMAAWYNFYRIDRSDRVHINTWQELVDLVNSTPAIAGGVAG